MITSNTLELPNRFIILVNGFSTKEWRRESFEMNICTVTYYNISYYFVLLPNICNKITDYNNAKKTCTMFSFLHKPLRYSFTRNFLWQ